MWSVSFNIIDLVIGIFGWLTVGYLAYRIFARLPYKPKVWKIVIVIVVGLFTFSINWNAWDTLIRIPILPLGVWILYAVLKRKEGRWENYRLFAWLGFGANFIFICFHFISIPIQHGFYPPDKPSTYISDVTDASVVQFHPSANDWSLHQEILMEQMDEFKPDRIMNQQWYEETYMNAESNNRRERFPYLLANSKPKWGSGIHCTIYIEDDGKGILIGTAKQQLYFRSERSILREGKQSE
ncbi:hypothetical protein ACFSCX_23605 [Bacillus salitolerans]|uniref:Uncharacterized protein n=1 Tax=Bacillus salitolerans TaxID=1437434 RepID=A0ABW4LWD6_9BACI